MSRLLFPRLKKLFKTWRKTCIAHAKHVVLLFLLMDFITKFMQSSKNIYASLSLFLISFWTFVTIFQCGNNEVKCAIIKFQNVNEADDNERTLNRKWPNKALLEILKYEGLWGTMRDYGLTLSQRRSLSYRNQPEQINWFLFDRDLRHKRVNN